MRLNKERCVRQGGAVVVSAFNLQQGRGENTYIKERIIPCIEWVGCGGEPAVPGEAVTAVRRWRTKPFYVRENYAKCASLELLQVRAVSICSSAVP